MDQKQIFSCFGARNWFLTTFHEPLRHTITEARVEMTRGGGRERDQIHFATVSKYEGQSIKVAK